MHGIRLPLPTLRPNEGPWNHSFLTHSSKDIRALAHASGPVLGTGMFKGKQPWSLPLRSSQSSGRDKHKQQLQNSVIKATVDIIAVSFRRQRGRLNLGRGPVNLELNLELEFASYPRGKRFSKPGQLLIHKSCGTSRRRGKAALSGFFSW